jgi:hypothetical protein
MATQYAMGHNQFPNDIQRAVDIMSNHRFDNQKETHKKFNENLKKDSEKTGVKKESSFAQSAEKMVCYCCGKKGHGVPKCPERDSRKREDWAINNANKKGANHNQQDANSGGENNKVEKDAAKFAFDHGRWPDDPEPLIAVGRAVGEITRQPIGDKGFGFDPVMFIPRFGKTFAELPVDVKNENSHRGQSSRQMLALMRERWFGG